MKTQVHKITIMVVDHDDMGADAIREVLESQRYPNRCINPRVVSSQMNTVEWSDDHPLNKRDTWDAEFARLFPRTPCVGCACSPSCEGDL